MCSSASRRSFLFRSAVGSQNRIRLRWSSLCNGDLPVKRESVCQREQKASAISRNAQRNGADGCPPKHLWNLPSRRGQQLRSTLSGMPTTAIIE